MKSIDGRLSKLERRFGIAGSEDSFLMIVSDSEIRGLGEDACLRILQEGGFPPPGRAQIVDFTEIPAGLNAKETERFVRENGAKICGGGGLPRIAKY